MTLIGSREEERHSSRSHRDDKRRRNTSSTRRGDDHGHHRDSSDRHSKFYEEDRHSNRADKYHPYSRDERSVYRSSRRDDDYDLPNRHRYRDEYEERSRRDNRRSYDTRDRSPRSRHHSARREAPRPVIKGTDEDQKTTTCLYMGRIPYDFREQDVRDLCERYGKLVSVAVPMKPFDSRNNKGFAFIEFEDRMDAQDALDKLQGFELDGRRLKLDWDIGQNKKLDIKGQ